MSNFILIAGLITVIALGLLLLPLRKTRAPISFERQEQNIHFAKERLQELETQRENDAISESDYEALKLELETTLAEDIDLLDEAKKEPASTEQQTSNKGLIVGLCVILPLLAAGIYTQLGTPEAVNSIATDELESAQPNAQQVQQMLTSIEQRLATNPNDPEGWTVLSRTYLALGRYEDAKISLTKLIEFGGPSANVYAQLADTTSLMSRGTIDQEALGYVEQALGLDPQQPQALWLAGLHAAQNGLQAQAGEFWGRLLPLLAQSPQQQQELKTIMEQTLSGETKDRTLAASQAAATAANKPATAPSPQTATASKPINLNVDVNLTVSVKVSPELSDKIDAGDTVFVFAKGQNGPPPPLAVKRLQIADLPAVVTLSDADAMVPQFKLSLFEDVQVSARISKSGNPTAQAGDLEALPIKVRNNETKQLELLITEIVN